MLRIMRCRILFSVFSLFTFSSIFSTIDASFSGRSEGLGRSYSAIATGFDAVSCNPANLAISPDFSFNILTLGFEYNSNLSIAEYMSLYSKGYFNDTDKKMFDNGEKLNILGSAQAFSFSFKNFALAAYAYTDNKVNIPQDVTDILFWGNKDLDRVYSLENIEGNNETGFAVAFSGARKLERRGNFSLGGTIRYLHGISYLSASDSYGSLTTTFYSADETKIYGNGGMKTKYAEGGYGVGADFGMIYFSENCNIGVSIINLFSVMTWDKGVVQSDMSFELDSVDLETFDVDSSLEWEEDTNDGPFILHPKPIFRIGGAMKKKGLLITSEFGYPQLFAIGIEYPSLWVEHSEEKIKYPSHLIVLRGGMTFTDSRFWFGFGIGLGIRPVPINLDIGIRMSSASHISGAISISVIPRD